MGLDQGVHAQLRRELKQLAQRRVAQGTHDQQHGVGTKRARLADLVVVDDEVLAQDGQAAGLAGLDEVGVMTAKVALIGQDRHRGGAVGRIDLPDSEGRCTWADLATRRRAAFELGDHIDTRLT